MNCVFQNVLHNNGEVVLIIFCTLQFLFHDSWTEYFCVSILVFYIYVGTRNSSTCILCAVL